MTQSSAYMPVLYLTAVWAWGSNTAWYMYPTDEPCGHVALEWHEGKATILCRASHADLYAWTTGEPAAA